MTVAAAAAAIFSHKQTLQRVDKAFSEMPGPGGFYLSAGGREEIGCEIRI